MGRRSGGPAPTVPDPRFAEALRYYQAGRVKEANDICQQILAGNPRDLNALHLTGLMALQVGVYEVAVNVLRSAIAVDDRVAPLHAALGEALHRLGNRDDAIRHYRRAIGLAPDNPGPHNALGIALTELGHFDEAIAAYQRALKRHPAFVAAHNNLGNAMRAKGDLAAATECYCKALALKRDYAPAHNNLGIVLLDQDRFDEAGASFNRAIAINANYAAAHYNLGNVARAQGDLTQAAACYRQALSFDPNHVEAHNGLGIVLRERGEIEAAIAAYRRALALSPNLPEALANLGGALRGLGDLAGAIDAERAALAQRPQMPLAEAELIYAQSLACDWTGYETWRDRLLAAARQPRTVSPFIMLIQASTLADRLLCAKQWIGATLPRSPRPQGRQSGAPSGKIRLGYLSGTFRDDVVGMLIPELIERHDKSIFEVSAFCYGSDDGGVTRRRLRAAVDHFHDIASVGPAEAARKIQEAEIDILVDLTGYTEFGRSAILAHRPAPIQVSYLGYPATMGADFIDYLIADRWIAPPADHPFYTEQLVHLPECYQPSDTRRAIAPAPTRAECRLPPDGFVFCCFNNSYKFTPAFFDIWSRLLRQVPGSVLWLVKPHRVVEQNLRREATARGVEPERLVFSDRVPMAEYLARLQVADLFLDTLPYNAGATANDALWAGLPVLTCSGATYTGRMAGSLLRAVGLPDLIADSPDAYEALALRLATEPELLAEVRQRLPRNRATMPLFDMARYTRHLEAGYRRMWEIWQRGEPPEPFAVEALPQPA